MTLSADLAAIPRQLPKVALGALAVMDPMTIVYILAALVVLVAVVTAALIILARQRTAQRHFILSVIKALRGHSSNKE